jgi:hypothetical protein
MNSILLKDDKILNIRKSGSFMAKVISMADISRICISRFREFSSFMSLLQARKINDRAGKAIRIGGEFVRYFLHGHPGHPCHTNQPKLVLGPYNLYAVQAFHE